MPKIILKMELLILQTLLKKVALDQSAHLLSNAKSQRKSRDLSNAIRLNPYSSSRIPSLMDFLFEVMT